MSATQDHMLFDLYKECDGDTAFLHLKRGHGGVATQLVPGDGSLIPKVIIVGEAPGAMEDRKGSPFVGPSGKFLDDLLRLAGLDREQVWITNVVKFRPPKNREPTEEEIKASLSYLKREVATVDRKGAAPIVALGRTASSAIAGRPISPMRLHGTWSHLQSGRPLFFSCHPSWGLRADSNKARMRTDFLQLGYDLGTRKKERT